jgi:dipeptidyl aminopeptidase/acylaminoacyl peptidase
VIIFDAERVEIGQVGRSRRDEISPSEHVRPGLPPTLVFHGTADKTVPFAHAEQFSQAMTEAGNTCQLEAFEGRGHGFFNGSFFRAKNGDDAFNQTMKHSLEFLTAHRYLPLANPQ